MAHQMLSRGEKFLTDWKIERLLHENLAYLVDLERQAQKSKEQNPNLCMTAWKQALNICWQQSSDSVGQLEALSDNFTLSITNYPKHLRPTQHKDPGWVKRFLVLDSAIPSIQGLTMPGNLCAAQYKRPLSPG